MKVKGRGREVHRRRFSRIGLLEGHQREKERLGVYVRKLFGLKFMIFRNKLERLLLESFSYLI